MTPSTQLKILLVEDEPNDAELIAYKLRREGLVFGSKRVQTMESLVEALGEFDPDIVLCDNNLPGFDARSAIQVTHAAHPELPIIVVTGTLEDEAAVELVRIGANDYVRKDRLERLPLAVTAALEAARQHRLQKASDAAMLVSELRHRRQFETAMDGILVASAETQEIYDVNQSLVDLLGYSRDDCLGRTLGQLGIRRLEDGGDLPIELMLRTGDRYQCPAMPLRTNEGRDVEVEVVAVAFRVGQAATIQCNLRDVTYRERMAKELQGKNRELVAASLVKDQFLASMSHELRTPLNGIIGFTGVLLMRLPGDLTPEQEKQLKTVRASADHLLSLINDLLNLAKIESGKMELDRTAVDCKKILEDVCASLGTAAAAKGLSLATNLPWNEVIVTTSQRALLQIVTNLAANAIKFTTSGRVCLEVCKLTTNNERRIEISIVDTGIGIRAEDQEKMFLAFSRIHDDATAREEGTGLGLHISQKLAALIGGRISFASEYGKGTTFVLTLKDDCLDE
jgi:PAS domain S-box-containing protein